VTLVSLDGVVRRHAEKLVLDGVTLGVAEGDRVGVIGVNGSGKSTLLRILAGVDAPDAGRAVHATGARIGWVEQEPRFAEDARVIDAVLDGDDAPARAAREYAAASAALAADPHDQAGQQRLQLATARMDAEAGWERERRARALLDRLGIYDVQREVASLSGGQRKRVGLARGLASDADLLVLDEPTNHLDVEAVEWLESELLGSRGALVLVTHDRYLLDRIATRIVEVSDGGIRSGYGSYVDYLDARALREEQAAAVERRRHNRARTELAWLRRGAQARTSKAKYRVEQATALLERRPDEARADVAFDLPSRRLGTKVVELHNAGVRYGDRWVLRGVEHRLQPDARVGVVGPNGSGKTTLLSLFAGRIEPDAGKVVLGETVAPGWYGQDPEALPADQRVLDAVDEVVRTAELTDGRRVTASQLLERFLFPPTAQRALVGELSGGERRRLELLRVLGTTPNLLLLDEPTNDLDLDTLAVLEEYLDGWPGALVVASHDRYFLDRVCSDLFSIESDGSVRHHPGGWTAWREQVRATAAAAAMTPAAPRSPSAGGRPAASGPRRLSHGERRELSALDGRMAALEERKAALAAALETGGDHTEIASTGVELAQVLADLDAAEERWLELSAVEEGV